MIRWCQWLGRGILLVALILFSAIVIYPLSLGGVVYGGKVEDGRYFVVSKGHRYTEVSHTQWRIEQLLEWCFWAPVVLIWIGGALSTSSSAKENPSPPPNVELPIWPYFVGVVITGIGAGIGWIIGRVPWTAVLGAWIALWSSVVWVVWFHLRWLLKRSDAKPPEAVNDHADHESS